MSYRLVQFPPQASTRSMRLPVRWMGLDGFLSSWLEEDDVVFEPSHRQIDWGVVTGLTLSLVISGMFWAGVGLLVSRFIR